jgi:hypothetical protein
MASRRVTYPVLPVPAYVPPSHAAGAAIAALLKAGPWFTPQGREVTPADIERVYALVCRRQRWPETGPSMRAVAILRDAGLIVRPRPPARPGAWVPADAPAPPPPKAPPRTKKAKPDRVAGGPDPACVVPAKPAPVARFWHRAGLDSAAIAGELDKACPRPGHPWRAAEVDALLGAVAVIDVRKRLPAARKLS